MSETIKVGDKFEFVRPPMISFVDDGAGELIICAVMRLKRIEPESVPTKEQIPA